MKPAHRKEFAFPVTVEFEDVDSYQIVHHTKLLAYLERARVHFVSSLGIDVRQGDIAAVVYDVQMRFRKPARLLDRLEVHVHVREFNEFRLVLGYTITRDGDTLVRATTSIAFADLLQQRMVEAPAEYCAALERYLADGAV